MKARSPASAAARCFSAGLLFADQPRREAGAALSDLRTLGLARQMLLTR